MNRQPLFNALQQLKVMGATEFCRSEPLLVVGLGRSKRLERMWRNFHTSQPHLISGLDAFYLHNVRILRTSLVIITGLDVTRASHMEIWYGAILAKPACGHAESTFGLAIGAANSRVTSCEECGRQRSRSHDMSANSRLQAGQACCRAYKKWHIGRITSTLARPRNPGELSTNGIEACQSCHLNLEGSRAGADLLP